MSFPNIPNINPTIGLERPKAINMLLGSIALEELSLAHLMNAEAEKVQFVLGTLNDRLPQNPTFRDIVRVNASMENMLKAVLTKEILLQFKLENVLDLLPSPAPPPPTPSPKGSISIDCITAACTNTKYPILGTVHDLMGNPLPGISVVVSTSGGTITPPVVVTTADGTFTTFLAAPSIEGSIVITATASLTNHPIDQETIKIIACP